MLRGNNSSDVYTYIPEVLAGLKKGDSFEVEFVKGDVALTSTVTGTLWNTRSDGNIAVTYRGKPFGFASGTHLERFVRLSQSMGKTVRATATIDKWTKQDGFPYIHLDIPSGEFLHSRALLIESFGPNAAIPGARCADFTLPDSCSTENTVQKLKPSNLVIKMGEAVGNKKPPVLLEIDGKVHFVVHSRCMSYEFLRGLADAEGCLIKYDSIKSDWKGFKHPVVIRYK